MRHALVFYREEWGQTPFTRIEQTAIRNRAFNEGFDFTVFVPTGKPPTAPSWLPKTRLWYGLESFGLKALAGVVEFRIQELGGEPQVERVADRAARFQRAEDLKEAKERFRRSDTGVREANAAFERLTAAMEQGIAAIATGRLQGLKFGNIAGYWHLRGGGGPWVVVNWHCYYTNSLDNSGLGVGFYDGPPPDFPGISGGFEKGRRLRELTFDYELLAHDQHGYVQRGDRDRSYSPEDLAEHILKLYLDAAEKHRRR